MIEGIEYDEAIVAFVSACYSVNVGFAEFVLGRKYKRLTGKVALTDDTTNTTPMPFVIVLDGKAQGRKNVTTTQLEINVDLNGVNRIRFELTQTGVRSYCRGGRARWLS
ncbi:MAG TPA: NPCBM/NEW2 domain-containing protein [Micromonosporaceae bacterium]|nr:NPCBM/NEW2 domain-containing protein [Micromonosporaceae bacterium]